ncbi:MAG: hypothetical protein IJJ28_01900, partial [Lentisphaeria bacterium]|nr:hypothetical protein [Lentisphaeria bacterium]
IVLLMLGMEARRRYRKAQHDGAAPSGRNYWVYFALSAVAFVIYAVFSATALGETPRHEIPFALKTLTIWEGGSLILLTTTWLTSRYLRDGWGFRAALAAWMLLVAGLLGRWLADSYRHLEKDVPRMNRNLLSCRKLIQEGKRSELVTFLEKYHAADCREWNREFEKAFPDAGGAK